MSARHALFWAVALGLCLLLIWGVVNGVGDSTDRPNEPVRMPAADDSTADRAAPETEVEAENRRRAESIEEPVLPSESSVKSARYGVTIHAENGAPLYDGRLAFEHGDEVYHADREGAIYFPETRRRGERFLAWAPGHLPAVARLSGREQGVALTRDFGYQLDLVWDDTGEPVEGAELELRACNNYEPYDYAWCDAKLEPLGIRPHAADEAGIYVIPSPRIAPSELTVHIRHPEARPYLFDIWCSYRRGGRELNRVAARLQRKGERRSFVLEDHDGQPLANRAVRVVHRLIEWSRRTDAEGRFDFDFDVNQPPIDVAQIWVDRANNEDWYGFCSVSPTAAETVLRIPDGRRKHNVVGRVLGRRLTDFEIALGPTLADKEDDIVYLPLPSPGDHWNWRPLASDGRFELTSRYWSVSMCVVVRHAESGQWAAWKLLDEQEPSLQLEVPETTRLSIRWRRPDGTDPPLGDVVFSPVEKDLRHSKAWFAQNEGIRFSVRDLPREIELLRQHFRIDFESEGLTIPLEVVDLRTAAESVEIELPAIREVRGRVFGALTGPIGGAKLRVNRAPDLARKLRLIASAYSRADGRFRLLLPVGEDFSVSASRPIDNRNPWLAEGSTGSGRTGVEERELQIEIPEARLEVRLPTWLPEVGNPELKLYEMPERDRDHGRGKLLGLRGGTTIPPREGREVWPLLVRPGRYVLSIGTAANSLFVTDVEVANKQSLLVEFPDSPAQTVFLSAKVPKERDTRYFVEIREAGKIATGGSWQRVALPGECISELLLPAGQYTFELLDLGRDRTPDERKVPVTSLDVDIEHGRYCEVKVGPSEGGGLRLWRE